MSPDTGTTTLTVDSAGNALTRQDARGVTGTFSYDALNRVTTASYPAYGGDPAETVTYTYDSCINGVGRLCSIADKVGTTGYAYDARGRVTSKSQVVAGLTQTVGYGYNSAGQLSTITTPSGQSIAYGYQNNRPVSVTVNGTTVLSGAGYEPFGPIGGWTWGNSTLASPNLHVRLYDLDYRVTSVSTDRPQSGTTPICRWDYTWDAASRITALTVPTSTANSFGYGYDALDRLTSVTPTGSAQLFGFSYDKVGNRLTSVVSGATTSYTYPTTSHRLSSLSGAQTLSYTYDSSGNQSAAGSVTWAYGGDNRPISVTTASTTTFAINALGQRVKKATGSAATRFVYDEAGHLLGEYDDTGALIQETVWLNDLPVATIRPDGASSVIAYYVHPDHLGTPRAVTRPSDNALVWKWENTEPFGNSLPDENPSGLGVFAYNLRFPGQYFDAETGKHYNYYRDYDPSTGRYIESDPIGLKGGINTYVYVNGPLTDVDVLGQMGARGGGDEHPDTKPCAYYTKMCNATNGSCGYYCRTAPFVCNVGYEAFVGIRNRNLNCVRRCLVDEDAKAQSGHGFGAGSGSAGSSSGSTCQGPHCQPDHVIDAYHKKCFMQCGVDPNRYPGVNPFGAAPNSPLNPNQGGQP